MQKIVIFTALWLLPVSLSAQWLNFKTPGIPRTADGKPNLTAPAPRTVDGHPDLSGLWQASPNMYFLDVIQKIDDESIFKPAAEAIFQKRAADYSRDFPNTHCLPLGPGAIFALPFRIIQSAGIVALLDGQGGYRQIFMDGRELPKDPNPTWRGYSIGHWEGDALAVETAGFNDRSWLDGSGHPHSENLRVTERFRRVDFGHMQFQVTFDDPETLTNPLTLSLPVDYQADTEMDEYVCENERDTAHLVGKVNRGVQLRVATLAKYAGTYELTGDNPGAALFFGGKTVTFTVVDGHLYLKAFPLIPQSETRFDALPGVVQFSVEASGAVTSVTISGAEGDATWVRKR
jgi:hypothetical protein